MKIETIDKNWIKKLEDLFSKSYGEKIDINEEIDYFNEFKPKNWYVSIDNSGIPNGFIRSFPYSEDQEFQIELFANSLDIKISLINLFDTCISNINKKFRFCLQKNQSSLIEYLKNIGYTHKVEEFKKFVLTNRSNIQIKNIIRMGRNEPKEILQIIDILSHFGKLSESKVIELINKNKIIVCLNQSCIVAAAMINVYEKFVEIVEISVLNEHRRKGYATECIIGITSKYPDKKIILEVNKDNIKAIKLYEKLGFDEKTEENKIWLTKLYK
jgi:GNAT superfamily N-acetyltransferase